MGNEIVYKYNFAAQEKDWIQYEQLENERKRNSAQDFDLEMSEKDEIGAFLNYSNKYNLNPDNVYQDAELKREGLKLLGLNCLTGNGGGLVPLDRCPEIRIGKVFRDRYSRIARNLSSKAM
ncbi:MAG: hypothetical protein WDZ77_01870 [Candidatus Pacearchaeota archaeon]